MSIDIFLSSQVCIYYFLFLNLLFTTNATIKASNFGTHLNFEISFSAACYHQNGFYKNINIMKVVE